MPNGDGTGPMGQGPGTGRGRGRCGAGMGYGMNCGFRGGCGFGRGRFISPVNEMSALENEEKMLLEQLEIVKAEKKALNIQK